MKKLLSGMAVVFSNLTAYAHGPGEGMGPGMMGWGGHGMGWPWTILILAFWIALIVGIVFLVRWMISSTRSKHEIKSEETARAILKKRYARGEITRDEFEKMKKDIGE